MDFKYIDGYVSSFIIFLAISSLALLFYVDIYFSNVKNSPMYNSGLLFIIYGAVTSVIINVIYMIIMKIISFCDKTNSTYVLNTNERNWIWVFLMLAYGVTFCILREYTYGCAYFALILGFFFWMFPDLQSLISKCKSLKLLRPLYWTCILVIDIISIIAIKLKPIKINGLSLGIGILGGLGIGSFLLVHTSKKKK